MVQRALVEDRRQQSFKPRDISESASTIAVVYSATSVVDWLHSHLVAYILFVKHSIGTNKDYGGSGRSWKATKYWKRTKEMWKRLPAKLLGLSKNVAAPVSDPSKMHYF